MALFCNIMLVQLGDIGDVALTTPAVRAVKAAYPEARVSIMVRKPYGSLLAADPHLYEIVEAARIRGTVLGAMREYAEFARRLRQAHYDLVIDLRTGDRGAILSFLTGAAERVGRHCAKPFWHDFLYTKLISELPAPTGPVHPGAYQSLCIMRAIGIDTADSTPRLHIAPTDLARAVALLAEHGLAPGGRRVTVNPYSRWEYKEWDNRKWGDVIDRLWQEYRIPAVLIGSPEEAEAAVGIVAGREGRAFNLAGKTTLGELAALISTGTLHMGVDSAAPHIAAAVGTPTVTIFGPGDWKGWTVEDNLHRVVTADMPCVPCGRKGCEGSETSRCLDRISADDVWKAVRPMLMQVSGDAAASDRPGNAKSCEME